LVVSYGITLTHHVFAVERAINDVRNIDSALLGTGPIMNANESEIRPAAAEIAPPLPAFPTRYLCFGHFQLDLQRESLWKKGERIRLQGKVYQTLVILLSRAGSIVTREEMRRHLWPENPQVNFEGNVNTTINKLRQALGDSPENPAYIETIPRRGYCFLAEVRATDLPLPNSSKFGESPARCAANAAQAGAFARSPEHSSAVTTGFRVATLVLAGMIVGALLVLAWLSYSRSHKALHSRSGANRVLRLAALRFAPASVKS
jgi:DNA-binding winged helix-turn-helix (wHTH) protein